MLTGRFQLAAPGDKLPAKTAVVLGFGPRAGAPARRGRAGRAARRGCRPTTRAAEVRYRDPTQMGKVYLRAGRRRPAGPGPRRRRAGPRRRRPGADPRGLARADPAPSRASSRTCCATRRSSPGIGNAYSDEILHAAGLLPFRKRSSLAAEEVDALYAATRATLARRDRRSCASASRRRSRRRSATSWRSTTRAASRARAAARGSPRSRPAGSSRRTAAAASADRAGGDQGGS